MALVVMYAACNQVAAQGTCLEVAPDSLEFYGDICNGWLYQESIEYQPIFIYAVCGDTGYYWEVSADQPWVGTLPDSGWDSDSALIYIDKEQLVGSVPDSLPPGDTLVLTATVTVTPGPADPVSPPQTVAVTLYLTCGSSGTELMVQPTAMYFQVAPGATAAESLMVYETHGQTINFWTYSASEWLYVDTMAASPLFTPEILWVHVDAGSMSPGYYSDTIFVYASEAGNSPLLVPVNLEVTGGGGEYTVETIPSEFNLILSQGEGATDSLQVFEIHGDTVPFFFYNSQPWLAVDPFPLPPYATPYSAVVAFGTHNLDPGVYVDTIVVYPIDFNYLFDTVRVPVTVTIHGGPVLVALPDHFELTVEPGGVSAHRGFLVYETHGDTAAFAAEVAGGSSWLDLEDTTPYGIYFTPDSVFFGIYATGLSPGFYVDTIVLYPPFDSIPFPPVAVPVFLHVDSGGGQYVVDALPGEFNVTLAPGESFYDSLHVFEIHGQNVPFQIYNMQPWLIVDPFPMPPYVTPMTFVAVISANGLPPGQYTDTIVISASDPDYQFDTVRVPVTLSVDSSEYVLVTEPTEFNYSVPTGHFFYDDLHIEELHGQPLLLNFVNAQPWLGIPLFFVPPSTPMTLEFSISTDSLPPGVYSDVITIIGYADPSQPAVAEANVPVTLTVTEDQPFVVEAAPDHFEYVLQQGVGCITDHFYVYDLDSANLPFATAQVNNSPWLIRDTSSATGVTPSQVYFQVCRGGLAPGIYGDTIVVYYPLDDMYGFDDVLVPVILHVVSDTLGAVVATEPESFDFVVPQGGTQTDELHVFETHGGTVPFHMWHQSAWLNFGFCDQWPYVTPFTCSVIVESDSLPAGVYYDTISIWPDTDGVSFPPVHVPVSLTVFPVNPGGGDSLIIPSISVSPCDYQCSVQPVQTKLSQPIKAAAIPIAIPEGVTICSLSTAGLVTQDWDWSVSEVNDSSGFAFMSLLNSFNARLPVGVTTVFNIYFEVDPLCHESGYFQWDTTLMLDVSRHLAFVDTTYGLVSPGFDMYRDSVEIIGYTPGDFDVDGMLTVSDLVGTVDYMFRYGSPPCVMNAVDVNSDCYGPDISDLVTLIDYMFLPWDPPPEFPPQLACGCVNDGAGVAKLNREITLTTVEEHGVTTLVLSSPVDLRGVQIEMNVQDRSTVEKLVGDQLDLVSGQHGNQVRLGLLDMDGAHVIPAGETKLLRVKGEVEVTEAVVSDGERRSMRAWLGSPGSEVPTGYRLSQNYPNPFNPVTEISLTLPTPSVVTLEVFNITGQRVAVLYDGALDAGNHVISWDARGFSSGVYFYKLTAPSFTAKRKMLLLK